MQETQRYSLNTSFNDSFIISQRNDETRDRWSRSVIVEGIDESQISVLLLLVTNRAKGGGEVEESQVDPDNRRVLLTFKDKQAADNFLSIGSISLFGTNLTVSQPILIDEDEEEAAEAAKVDRDVDSWEEIRPMAEENGTPIYMRAPSSHDPEGELSRVVFVGDVPDALTEEKLKNLLESNGLADAEEIERVELFSDTKVAKITLFDSKVAAKICRRQTVNYKDKVLSFSFELKKDDDDNDNVFDDGVFDTLKVTCVSESVSIEMLRLYFENPSRSGGGTVCELSPKKTPGEFVVKFQDHNVASRVFHRVLHQLDEVSFSVVPLERVEVTKCCAIEVEGLGRGHSEDLLKLYFEHQRFGDATVEDVIIDRLRGKAVVTFKQPQDVEKVLSPKTHVLSSAPLTLSRLDPLPPAPLLLEQTEDTRLLATGLPSRTKLFDLQKYFGKLSGVRLTAAYLMNKPSKCLLEFEAAPDYKQLKALVHAKPFRGVMISIRKVPLTTSIEVLGVYDLSDEILTLFFENHQHGKGKVVEIKRQPDQGRTFIKFEKPDVIPGLLRKTLKLEGRTLKVCWHHSFLDVGSIPLEDGTPGFHKSGSFKSLPLLRNRVLSEPSMGLHMMGNQTTSLRPSMMLFEEADGDITPTASLVDLTSPEKMENLKPYHNRLLMLIGFEKQLMGDAGGTQTRITLDEVSLFGSEDSRASLKIKVLEKLMSVVARIQHSSEVKGKLMRRVAVQEYVHGICQQRDIKATLASDPTLQVCAFDEQENVKLENILTFIIKELEFAFDVSDATATFLSDELKKRQQEIEFIIDAVQKKIRIACVDKDEVQIREFVEKFIRDNSRVEKRVSISKQVKDYILQHKAEEFYRLKENFLSEGGSLVCSEDAVILNGRCTIVDSAEAQLRKMADSLVAKSYTVDHPAGETFLRKTTAGKLIVKGIESEDKTVITVKSTTHGSSSSDLEAEFVSSTEITSSPECTILMRLTNNRGNVVTVVSGHIESQMVDAIVNSVDKNLRLDGGDISNSIFVAAGSSLLDECKKKAPIEFGKIVCTKGYNLPCQHVFHGAAMQWDGGRGRSKKILAEVIRNCLEKAHSTGVLRSIAFPAIGAGILKFPEDVVIETLLEEIETFNGAHPATTLKDIRFVINSEVLKSKLDSLVSQSGSWRKLERRPLKSNPIKTSLVILAASENAADDVCKKIEDILKDQTAVDCIDSPSDAQAIGFVTNEKVFRCFSK